MSEQMTSVYAKLVCVLILQSIVLSPLANRHQPVTIFPPSSTMTHPICSPSRKANLDPILQRSLSRARRLHVPHFTPSTATICAAI
ncbi:hypothetical protein T4B_8821 [Trichinella pseudospiralis]|uniref:Secreted protein n=1 Tax=Trichinella pseudospiralis TaxID=6337 RepID=A0A0V1JRJ9_TRIPS|nr:hypothetical protein T4A_8765 [Trichinella pseudospiralis]KRZ33754.1 hypothetical protein T4B_8821 [Trichinella pseudospiralis]KRZ37599.1 hypothetical protein T4C_10527 [Trichinella pseudospiralis]